MIKAILCVGRNGELGDSKRPDGLPWDNNPEDLSYFKSKTEGDKVVYGRKTFDSFRSLGMKFGLPNRRNFVLTSNPYLSDYLFKEAIYDDTEICSVSESELKDLFKFSGNTWIIGGKSIYDQCMQYVEEVHITMIDKVFPEADTYMDLSFLREFELQSLTELNDYSIVYVYKRKK